MDEAELQKAYDAVFASSGKPVKPYPYIDSLSLPISRFHMAGLRAKAQEMIASGAPEMAWSRLPAEGNIIEGDFLDISGDVVVARPLDRDPLPSEYTHVALEGSLLGGDIGIVSVLETGSYEKGE